MESIWPSVQEAFQAIGPHYQPQTEENFNIGLWALDAAEVKTLLSLLAQFKEGLIIPEPALV